MIDRCDCHLTPLVRPRDRRSRHGRNRVDYGNFNFALLLTLHNDVARQQRSNLVFGFERPMRQLRVTRAPK